MIKNAQKGVSLIITFFIMVIILLIVLFVSALLYSELKVITNIGNSVVSFYAADSGIEKVLYYDKQVMPSGEIRGLCTIYTNCQQDPTPSLGNEHSIYCSPNVNFVPPVTGTTDSAHGCDSDVCDDCAISFQTNFDDRTYTTTAKVFPSTVPGNEDYSDLEIDSTGVFSGAERAIQALLETPPPAQ
jgi:hypothetical protein